MTSGSGFGRGRSRGGAEEALKHRLVEAARRRLEAQEAFYKEGRITIDRFLEASHELMHAEIQASKTREGRITAAQAHLDRVKRSRPESGASFKRGEVQGRMSPRQSKLGSRRNWISETPRTPQAGMRWKDSKIE